MMHRCCPLTDVVGFYFLDQATSYTPPPELQAFLKAGEPPVYIGFGSVVVDDPEGMTSELNFFASPLAVCLRRGEFFVTGTALAISFYREMTI
jgi:hypothetical protein